MSQRRQGQGQGGQVRGAKTRTAGQIVDASVAQFGAALKFSGQAHQRMAAQLEKTSEALVWAEEELALYKVAHDMAQASQLQYRTIPQWVQEKLSAQKDNTAPAEHCAAFFAEVLKRSRSRAAVEDVGLQGSRKTSAPREDASSRAGGISEHAMAASSRFGRSA